MKSSDIEWLKQEKESCTTLEEHTWKAETSKFSENQDRVLQGPKRNQNNLLFLSSSSMLAVAVWRLDRQEEGGMSLKSCEQKND